MLSARTITHRTKVTNRTKNYSGLPATLNSTHYINGRLWTRTLLGIREKLWGKQIINNNTNEMYDLFHPMTFFPSSLNVVPTFTNI